MLHINWRRCPISMIAVALHPLATIAEYGVQKNETAKILERVEVMYMMSHQQYSCLLMGLAGEEELNIELNMNLQPPEQDLAISLGHCCHNKRRY